MKWIDEYLFHNSKFRHSLVSERHTVIRRIPFLIFLTTMLILPVPRFTNAEWVDKIFDGEVVTTYDDNITNAFSDSDEKNEIMFDPSISLGRYYQLGNFTRIRATADIKGNIHDRFNRLNSVFVGATLAASYKMGLGLYKPWLRVHSSGGYLEVNDDLRDSVIFETGLTIGKRIHERVDVQAGYTYDFREGRGNTSKNLDLFGSVFPNTNGHGHSDHVQKFAMFSDISGSVFDQAGHKLSILSNFLVTNKILISLGYSIRHGDITSTNNGQNSMEVWDDIRAITLDNSYNKPLSTYKIRSTIQEISLGMTYALSGHTSLNLNYNYTDGNASGQSYFANILNIGFNYSF